MNDANEMTEAERAEMFELARRYWAEQELFDHNERAEAENADEGRGFWSGSAS
jgi:hypothetical protein